MESRSKWTLRSRLISPYPTVKDTEMNNNNPHTATRRGLGALQKATYMLLLIAGGWVLVVPASGQSTEEASSKSGSIVGTVVDIGDDPIPNATVVLQGLAVDRVTAVTKDDGSFAFHDVKPGIAYE